MYAAQFHVSGFAGLIFMFFCWLLFMCNSRLCYGFPWLLGVFRRWVQRSAVLGGLAAVHSASSAAVVGRDAGAALTVAGTGGFSP